MIFHLSEFFYADKIQIHLEGTHNSRMHLTHYTDYSLRALIYLSVHPAEKVSIQDVADFFEISKDHLVKVVHNLSRLGYIESIRGRHGGIKLAKPPNEINVGEVVRNVEPHFHLVDCMNGNADHCNVVPVCRLKGILQTALDQFVAVLDQYTVADLVDDHKTAVQLVGIDL
jgi:Rrf2 family nitric oxide-sensitive transcriptional repressor